MRILVEDTLGLIIDYQERLIPVINNKEELLSNTQKLIEGLKALEVPMIISQQYTKGLGMTVPDITDIFENDFKYYDKTSFSCMDDKNIKDEIKKSNKKNVIICGIESHICVLQTVVDLIASGYNVILITDCISSRKKKDTDIAIERAIKEGAIVSTYESILFELTRMAGSDLFKSISKIIK